MSLRSGCALQAELAHFASAAFMNLTVSSSGDPHRDSCATLGEMNPTRSNRASPKTDRIEANFMALFYFSSIAGQALNSPNDLRREPCRPDCEVLHHLCDSHKRRVRGRPAIGTA